jgi:methionyl-tRNA formyltransferase
VQGAGAPGEILGISDAGLTIAGGDGAILVSRVRPHDDRAKIAAGEYAKARGLNVGSRLGD